MIKLIRIKNYRSIESLELELGKDTLLIGRSDTGKSNLIRAINLSLGMSIDVSESDIFIKINEQLLPSKSAIIDIMFLPVDQDMNIIPAFSTHWSHILSEFIKYTSDDYEYFSYRTEISYDTSINKYRVFHKLIESWGNTIDSSILGSQFTFSDSMKANILPFFLDTNRDIVADLNNKNSIINKMTSSFDTPADMIQKIEDFLRQANESITAYTPSIKKLSEAISEACNAAGLNSISKIEAVPSKLSGINRSLDILLQGGGAAISISRMGQGARSVLSSIAMIIYFAFLNKIAKINDVNSDLFIMVTFEEIETHLHPQIQRQLYRFIVKSFQGQTIISTHSSTIVTQANILNCVFFSYKNGRTITHSFPKDDGAIADITRIIPHGHYDMLFASAIVMCEGQTEELALPIFFTKYFGKSPENLGIIILGLNGLKFKTYLYLIRDLDIPWFIISDGEEEATEALRKAAEDVLGVDYSNLTNIVVIGSGKNYESQLIAEGYTDIIISALNNHYNKATFFRYLQGNPNNSHLSKEEVLLKYCISHKVECARVIANAIISLNDRNMRFPSFIIKLLDAIKTELNLTREES
jgi:putative ATP-dependent endonuclease of OLD family